MASQAGITEQSFPSAARAVCHDDIEGLPTIRSPHQTLCTG